MIVRRSTIALAALLLSGCGSRQPEPAPRTSDADNAAAVAAAQAMVDNVMAGASEDADRARVDALENRVDEISDQLNAPNTLSLEERVSALEAKVAAGGAGNDAADAPGTTKRSGGAVKDDGDPR